VPKPTAQELKAVPLFASINDRDRELLATGLAVAHVAPGTAVIREGQPNAAFYIVQQGELDVSVGHQRRQTLYPGHFFGEISLGRATPATASVMARTDATLYVLDEAAFRTLVQNTDAVLRIRGAMTDREAADRMFGKPSAALES
jgi:CRP-like cAMP-binding protein